jgi:glucosamine--fructose-6-phosphate aminotransferase (isomerizing)
MEYRGYDSAGIPTLHNDKLFVRKGVGKVADVNRTVHLDILPGQIGVGHTRWATHGGVTDVNAHPHPSSSGQIAIVHNGIIDNHKELKEQLIEKGYTFRSETDSEVIANLLQWNFDETGDVRTSILKSIPSLTGNYAFAAVFPNGTLAGARFHEPLTVGIGSDGYFVASDILGFAEQTDKVIYIDNRELLMINHDSILISNFEGKHMRHEIIKISTEIGDVEKGDYVHHTLKEIFEQPVSIPKAGERTNGEISKAVETILQARKLYITGSGSGFHSALIGKYLLAKYAKISPETIISSEARFSPVEFDEDCVLIAISQSGESADVLEAVNLAKEKGAKIVSIVNVMTSSLAHISDVSTGLNCGPEIGVAATKSFTSQMAVLYKLTDAICGRSIGPRLDHVSTDISTILEAQPKIEELAKTLRDVSDIYVLGMGIHYCLAAEASLKLKELAYVHAEALPGGELKHGPLALLDSSAYIIMLNPSDTTYVNAIAAAHEVKARGAKIIGISDEPSEMYDYWIELPKTDKNLYPMVEIIPMQLLSYFWAVSKNANPDYPRNLAKSVTVK